jgi:hypothetical protein
MTMRSSSCDATSTGGPSWPARKCAPPHWTFDSDFRSRVPGAAHLCGHDIHTAIAVGAAEELGRAIA